MRRNLLPFLGLALLAGCTQNWDLMQPESDPVATAERSFTRLAGEPQPLTNEIAIERLQRIEETVASERVELVERFLDEFPEARLIGDVHRLAGEGYLAVADAEAAAASFERALVMTRTDLLGIPLETELPLQLAMAQLSAGQVDDGLAWLARTSVVDHGQRMNQSLRWAYSQFGSGDLRGWLTGLRMDVLQRAPGFDLPGLSSDRVRFDPGGAMPTLVNFWSPT